jgi:hypothetical protein
MGDILAAAKKVEEGYRTVFIHARDVSNLETKTAREQIEKLQKIEDEKEFKAQQKEILEHLDSALKLKTEMTANLKRWHVYAKVLEKLIDDEIKVREKAYKALWDNAQMVKEVNRIIRERNERRADQEKRDPKLEKQKPIEEEKEIDVPTTGVADIKSLAAENMLWLKFIEDIESRIDEFWNGLERARSLVKKAKPAKRKK